MDKYITRKEVLKILGIHYHTLYSLARRNEIETLKVGSRTLYNLDSYMRLKGVTNGPEKRNICYCRVSSPKQKPDLNRQINEMKAAYPSHRIISDVASSLNFERKGLSEIIDLAIKGEINELVIAYKDRLARIGYELIESIITKYSKGKITILNKTEEETPEEELTKDVITIMNVYVAKVNGLRRYKKPLVYEIKKTRKS
jgi:putative resolvase